MDESLLKLNLLTVYGDLEWIGDRDTISLSDSGDEITVCEYMDVTFRDILSEFSSIREEMPVFFDRLRKEPFSKYEDISVTVEGIKKPFHFKAGSSMGKISAISTLAVMPPSNDLLFQIRGVNSHTIFLTLRKI